MFKVKTVKYWIYHIDGILVLICVLAKDLSHLQPRLRWMNRQSRSLFGIQLNVR